jgi:hypothetical protein
MAILRTYSAITAQLGTQAQWQFDETGGAIAVDSADGLQGEQNGSVTFGETGPVGADGAAPLGGNGSFVLVQSAIGGRFGVDMALGDSLVAGFGLGASSIFVEAAPHGPGPDSSITAFGQNGHTSQALGAVQTVIESRLDVAISVSGTSEPANALPLADPFEATFLSLAAELDVQLFTPDQGGVCSGDAITGGSLGDAGLSRGDGGHPDAAGVNQIVGGMLSQATITAAASGTLQSSAAPLLLGNSTIELGFDVSVRQGLFSEVAAGLGSGGPIGAAIENGVVSAGLVDLSAGAFVQSAVQANADTHLAFTFAGGTQLLFSGAPVDSHGFTGGLDIGIDGPGGFEPLVLGALVETSLAWSIGTPTTSFADAFESDHDRALAPTEIQQPLQTREAGARLTGTPEDDALIGGIDDETLRGPAGNDDLEGGGGNEINKGVDAIDAGSRNDLIDCGPGPDILTGGPGADRLAIAQPVDGVGRLTDFEVGAGGDVLDIGSILQGFEPDTSRAADFVRLGQSDGDTTLSADPDGAGNGFAPLADPAGGSGVSLDQLVADGNPELT